ncbi:MAG: efflux RND transporter permease subunit [Burkholderiaceae bacterium]|nr:efflux RND transporter permease subunit [Burkholderiaceae bacterium]
MNLSTWSIRNPIPSLLLFILLTLLGLMSFRAMKIQNFPDIDLPTVIVTAALPGAAPAQLETEVARKIENSIATIPGIKHIYGKIQDGSVAVTAEFRLEKDVSQAVDDVRDAVSRIRADLPQALRDPIVSKLEISGTPVLTYSIASGRMDEEALSWFVDNEVTRALLTVPGVGKVARVGGVTREVRVELDPALMQALDVTAAEISRRVRQVQQESSGGRATIGGREQAIRTIGTVATAAELARLDIPLLDGRHVRLDEVATVTDTIAERRSAALLDGEQVVGFEISRSRGASEVSVAEGVRDRLRELKAEHPDIEITEAFNFVEPVESSYVGSLNLLFEGAVLAVIVVFLFLRDWRATFVAATALPLSIIPTFAAMYFMGFTINVVTLLAMSLVVGILVDDAIVEIENIVRHLGMGKTPKEAAMEAVEEIGLAVVATTATLVAVFLPTAFMTGVAGMFFKQFGWTAAIAVFASLLVARLLTPMMAAYLLRPATEAPRDSWLMTRYLRWVGWCLRHRFLTSLAAAAFFVASLLLIPLLPTGFIPPDDLAQTQVTVELPPGSTFAQTYDVAEQVRVKLMADPDVLQVYTAIGGGATGSDPFAIGGAPEARKATLLLNLSPRKGRDSTKQQIEDRLRAAVATVAGIRTTVGFGGAGEKLIVALTGDDGQALAETSRAVVREIRGIEGLGNVTSSAALTRPELVVRPDVARAADLGVTSEAIAETLRVATAGDYEQSLAKLNLAQRQVPIVVRLPEQARDDLTLLERLKVPGNGGNVPLANVASLEVDAGPAQIDRYDRSRNVLLEVELNGQALGDVLSKVDRLPTLANLPPGVKRAELGDVEGMRELFESFGLAMLIGVACIYTVLVLLFKDFMQPVTILAALPLSIGGAFVALLLTGKGFSMPSLIGLIMLMGVATKNSILLVEYAIVARRDHGMDRTAALLDACHKRARPIIMTTIAMGAGMLPIALGLGVDPSFRSPMAMAVIGGLVTSTFLSLLIIPVVFTFIDDLIVLARRLLQRGGQASGSHGMIAH